MKIINSNYVSYNPTFSTRKIGFHKLTAKQAKAAFSKEKIEELISKKYSVDEMAKELNCSSQDLEMHLTKIGARVFHAENRYCHNPVDEQGKLNLLARSGDSCVQIAEIYGVSSKTAKNWLDYSNILSSKDKPSPRKEDIINVLEQERKLYRPIGKVYNFGEKLGISNDSFMYLVEKYGLDELYWRVRYNI